MNQLLGIGITVMSVMTAAIVSGIRLKPYIEAGEQYTPLTFAFYPALIAAVIAVPVVLLVRWWQGKKEIDIGPVTFMGNMPFIVLGCLLYVVVAVTFFPYKAPPPRPPKSGTMQHASCSRRTFPCILPTNTPRRSFCRWTRRRKNASGCLPWLESWPMILPPVRLNMTSRTPSPSRTSPA